MDKKRLEELFREYLKSLGVQEKEVLQNTPRRFLNFLEEYTVGFKPFEDVKNFEVHFGDYNQMIVSKTHFMSICEHHLLPYFGTVYVGYLPRGAVVGASKIVKLVQHLSKRPTIQEKLTEEIANGVKKMIPDVLGVIVVIRAFHTCVARHKEGWLVTSSLHGAFKHNVFAKQEFFDLIQNEEKEVF